jgi:hypothetical protein
MHPLLVLLLGVFVAGINAVCPLCQTAVPHACSLQHRAFSINMGLTRGDMKKATVQRKKDLQKQKKKCKQPKVAIRVPLNQNTPKIPVLPKNALLHYLDFRKPETWGNETK